MARVKIADVGPFVPDPCTCLPFPDQPVDPDCPTHGSVAVAAAAFSRGCAIHWFAYYGSVGSSSPVCVRCGSPNPRYRPGDDPHRGETLTGLTNKFRVERTRPSSRGIDHTGCPYFVLDPTHDSAARVALTAYAHAVRSTEPELAADLDALLISTRGEA